MQIAFAVLDTIFAWRFATLELEFVILETEVLEHLLKDVAGLFVLKDTSVLGLFQERKPGDDGHVVPAQAVRFGASHREGINKAMKDLFCTAFDGDGNFFADQGAGFDRVVGGEGGDHEDEGLGDALLPFKPGEQELVLAERRVEGNEPVSLGILGHVVHGWPS